MCVFVHVAMWHIAFSFLYGIKGNGAGGGEAGFDCLAPDLLTQIRSM